MANPATILNLGAGIQLALLLFIGQEVVEMGGLALVPLVLSGVGFASALACTFLFGKRISPKARSRVRGLFIAGAVFVILAGFGVIAEEGLDSWLPVLILFWGPGLLLGRLAWKVLGGNHPSVGWQE